MTASQFLEKNRAYQRVVLLEKASRTEANKSRQVSQFLQDMLKGIGPSVAMGRDTKLLREISDDAVKRVGNDLHDQPEVEAELLNFSTVQPLNFCDALKSLSCCRGRRFT